MSWPYSAKSIYRCKTWKHWKFLYHLESETKKVPNFSILSVLVVKVIEKNTSFNYGYCISSSVRRKIIHICCLWNFLMRSYFFKAHGKKKVTDFSICVMAKSLQGTEHSNTDVSTLSIRQSGICYYSYIAFYS